MIISFPLQQKQKTSNLDGNLVSRQYKLFPMAKFVRIKYEKPKMKQIEKAIIIRHNKHHLWTILKIIKN